MLNPYLLTILAAAWVAKNYGTFKGPPPSRGRLASSDGFDLKHPFHANIPTTEAPG